MRARTSRELGAAIRRARRDRGWTQAQLAEASGTTRAWVISAEHGKATVELGLVLRTLSALDLVVDVVAVPTPRTAGGAAVLPAPVAARGTEAPEVVTGRAVSDLGGIVAAARSVERAQPPRRRT